MANTLISHKSPRRRLFDDEIMAQIALRAADLAVRPKRRRFSFRALIALMFLFIVLVARTSTRYLLMNRDTQPPNLVELKVESPQTVRRDVEDTITKSCCIPESNVVANPMFVDFVHWDKAPLYYGYNTTYWLTDGSPAGAYMYYIPESKYPDGDYPSLIQKITLTPGLEYNISLSAQFRPRKLDSKQYHVALLVAEDENFRSIIYTFTSHIMQITNGTFFGTFGATASTAHVKLMAASLDYDTYFHKLTIYPSEDTTCGHQDALSPLDLIGIN
ncbi:uncharacterized protein V1513DRAFT_429531 [Lipomyces chichibuensis]|uniref:uncharacterized protein n=1 Tax=Lipomyces chichibuensis TaxID=1546026 RepID=UPI00334337EC